MPDKFHSDTKEKIELIQYNPYVQNTGDLEPGTHTIVPTSRPPIGSAQYSKVLTLPKPADARLAVLRIATRLNVNIVGLGTATVVACSVRVDVDDTDHELFSLAWTSTGSKLDVLDITSAVKPSIFAKLSDGAAHTFYFMFWADAANQATIDLVQLWEGVGSSGTDRRDILLIDHSGFMSYVGFSSRVGSGTGRLCICAVPSGAGNLQFSDVSSGTPQPLASILSKQLLLVTYSSVATDIVCFQYATFQLRSEQ